MVFQDRWYLIRVVLSQNTCTIMITYSDSSQRDISFKYHVPTNVPDLPDNVKPLTLINQACWYSNKKSFYKEFEYGNIILI